MNKSKFLKKSLAMVLAVMLVVAMIPMSASAASVGDGTIVSIDGAVGTVTGSGKTYTDTVDWISGTQQETGLSVVLKQPSAKSFDAIVWGVADEDGTVATWAKVDAENDKASITGQTWDTDTTVKFFAVNKTKYEADVDTEEKSETYTVNVVLTPASSSTEIAEAKIGNVTGKVDEAAKTITFANLPWQADPATVVTATLKLKYPVSDAGVTVSNITVGTDKEVSVEAQNGSSNTYTIKTSFATGLTNLTIAGVVAKLDEDETHTDPATYGCYVVQLPEGTDITKVPVSFTSKVAAAATFDGMDFVSGKEFDFTDKLDAKKTLKLTATVGSGVINYDVWVKSAKGSGAAITAFTATEGGYTENGTVSSDKKLTVEMPKGSTLTSVDLDIVVSPYATVGQAGTAGVSDTGTGKVTLTGVNLSKGDVTLKVASQDGKTVNYYTLTATVAKDPSKDPKITAAKLTIGTAPNAKEYQGVINETTKTIKFKVPFATTADDVKVVANYTFAKTSGTKLDTTAIGNITDLTKTFDITATGTEGDVNTYTVSFEKEKAETGKTITDISFTSAATSDKVTTDNTYKAVVGTDKLTVNNLPHVFSTDKKDAEKLVAQFTLPKGAKLYTNDMTTTANLNKTPVVSGYNEDKDPENTITLENFKAATTKIVVADETAAMAIKDANGNVTMDDLKAAPYKGHVTIYTIEPKYVKANGEAVLKTLTEKDTENVTSKISGNSIEITVPSSYNTTDGSKKFIVAFTASTGAVVKVNTTTSADLEDGSTQLNVKDGKLYLADAAVTSFSVKSEDEKKTTVYDKITVKVNPVETGAAITALKVGKVNATISGKSITATLPYNSDLTKQLLGITASKMAEVKIGSTLFDPETEQDVSQPVTITVTAENEKTVSKYTLTVKTAEQFSDIKDTDWFYSYVMDAAAAGIVEGRPDGTFGPKDNVKRRDFALMVVRMLDADVSKYTTTPFSDVKSDDYALQAIAYCAEEGIIGGDGDGKFRPGDTITRQEAAKVIATALKLTNKSADKFMDDASISNWAKDYVYACKAAGIFEGTNNVFNPKSMITRAETAKVLSIANNK